MLIFQFFIPKKGHSIYQHDYPTNKTLHLQPLKNKNENATDSHVHPAPSSSSPWVVARPAVECCNAPRSPHLFSTLESPSLNPSCEEQRMAKDLGCKSSTVNPQLIGFLLNEHERNTIGGCEFASVTCNCSQDESTRRIPYRLRRFPNGFGNP